MGDNMNLILMSQRFTYIQNMHYDYNCFPSQGIRFGKKLELHIYENCDDEDEDEEEISNRWTRMTKHMDSQLNKEPTEE